jgi:hypothetical protein
VSAVRGRRRPCNAADAQIRARQARAFLSTAELVRSETHKPEEYDYNHVAAALAVLAAIAASDALCCALLGERSRGQDHRDAADLLAQVRFGEGNADAQSKRADDLAAALASALDVKDESHYGTKLLGADQLRRVMRAADRLVSAASEVTRR